MRGGGQSSERWAEGTKGSSTPTGASTSLRKQVLPKYVNVAGRVAHLDVKTNS